MIVNYLPQPDEMVIADCEAFSSAAKLDSHGIWRCPYNNQPIESRVVGWEPF
jgi:hypothetical protein